MDCNYRYEANLAQLSSDKLPWMMSVRHEDDALLSTSTTLLDAAFLLRLLLRQLRLSWPWGSWRGVCRNTWRRFSSCVRCSVDDVVVVASESLPLSNRTLLISKRYEFHFISYWFIIWFRLAIVSQDHLIQPIHWANQSESIINQSAFNKRDYSFN